jgi:hypothetical protein
MDVYRDKASLAMRRRLQRHQPSLSSFSDANHGVGGCRPCHSSNSDISCDSNSALCRGSGSSNDPATPRYEAPAACSDRLSPDQVAMMSQPYVPVVSPLLLPYLDGQCSNVANTPKCPTYSPGHQLATKGSIRKCSLRASLGAETLQCSTQRIAAEASSVSRRRCRSASPCGHRHLAGNWSTQQGQQGDCTSQLPTPPAHLSQQLRPSGPLHRSATQYDSQCKPSCIAASKLAQDLAIRAACEAAGARCAHTGRTPTLLALHYSNSNNDLSLRMHVLLLRVQTLAVSVVARQDILPPLPCRLCPPQPRLAWPSC